MCNFANDMDDKNTIQTTMSSLINDVRDIVENGLRKAYQNVNAITVFTYWQVGKRVAKGYTLRDLRIYRQSYLCFNDLEIWYSRVPNLTWTHFRTLLNTLFEHKNCISIKPYYYIKQDGTDNYLELVQNISRNFTDMKLMRDRVVNKTYCAPLTD